MPTKERRKRERSQRFEMPIDDYVDRCIMKIVGLGFASRKDAVRFAVMKIADMVDRGEIKKEL